jgi:hypothetical protein
MAEQKVNLNQANRDELTRIVGRSPERVARVRRGSRRRRVRSRCAGRTAEAPLPWRLAGVIEPVDMVGRADR